MTKTVIFCLDARVQLTPAEAESVNRYKLGAQVIYNSEASKRHLAVARGDIDSGSFVGSLKAMGSIALAAMNLNITISSLSQGQHIECKSLEEVIGAEQAITEACQNLQAYLATAAQFNGQEVVVDFTKQSVNA